MGEVSDGTPAPRWREVPSKCGASCAAGSLAVAGRQQRPPRGLGALPEALHCDLDPLGGDDHGVGLAVELELALDRLVEFGRHRGSRVKGGGVTPASVAGSHRNPVYPLGPAPGKLSPSPLPVNPAVGGPAASAPRR